MSAIFDSTTQTEIRCKTQVSIWSLRGARAAAFLPFCLFSAEVFQAHVTLCTCQREHTQAQSATRAHISAAADHFQAGCQQDFLPC